MSLKQFNRGMYGRFAELERMGHFHSCSVGISINFNQHWSSAMSELCYRTERPKMARIGAPKATGSFETRSQLESFIRLARYSLNLRAKDLAIESGVEIHTVRRILKG